MSSPSPIPSVTTTATIVVSVIFPVLSLVAIILRYRARRTGQQRLQADDWWIVITWIVTFALSITTWVFAALSGVNYLKGNPEVSLRLSTQGLWIEALLLEICLATVKISILCFYKRIFSIPRFVMAANIGIAIITIWAVIYSFLIIFQDDPISGAWTGQGHQVIDSAKFNLSQAGTSIVLDFLVLCFPVPIISRLHMKTKRKVAIVMIFWLGGFCCIAAILRLVYLVKGETAAADSRSSGGYTAIADDAKTAIFITVEPNCSIIAASLPCYGPLLERGRALDSLVRSVRSVLSLGSRTSDSRSPRGSGGTPKRSRPKLNTSTSGDSQIELHEFSREWASSQSQGQNVAHVKPLPHSVNATEGHLDHGIEVTKTYGTGNEQV